MQIVKETLAQGTKERGDPCYIRSDKARNSLKNPCKNGSKKKVLIPYPLTQALLGRIAHSRSILVRTEVDTLG